MSRLVRGTATALFAVSLCLPSVARADAPDARGHVTALQGPVSIRPAGGTAFHAAQVGEALYAGEELKTGPQGDVHLLWGNGGEFELLPESDMIVPSDAGVLIDAGQVWAKFEHKLLAPFYFRGPSANAVVRGTILGVSVLPDGGTHVAVLEGLVEVAGRSGTAHLMLTPGQSVTISPLGTLGPTEPVSRMEREQGPRRVGMIAPAPGMRPRPDGTGDADDRPGGPGGPGAPDRPSGPAVRGGFAWLTQNRAAVRLESVREQMQRPAPIRRDADHDGKVLDNAAGAGPVRPFPDGRPRAEMPPCLPAQPTANTDTNACPPPPPGGQPR